MPKGEIKYKPPKCPNCGCLLKVVWETEYNTYVFNPKTGGYEDDEYRAEIEIRCPNCESRVEDIFEEGACNYQAKETERW